MTTKTSQLMFRLTPEVANQYRQCLARQGLSIQQHLEQQVLALVAQYNTTEARKTEAPLIDYGSVDGLLQVFSEQGIPVSGPST